MNYWFNAKLFDFSGHIRPAINCKSASAFLDGFTYYVIKGTYKQ